MLLIFSIILFYVPNLVLTDEIGDLCTDLNGLLGECLPIGDDKCSHILMNKIAGLSNYKKCGVKDAIELVCCAEREPFTAVEPDLNRKYVQKCKEYKELMFDSEIDYTTGARPTRKKISECDKFSYPLIVGGANAEPKEFPHMAILGCKTENGTIIWLCGGSLISLNHVITAAHCFEMSNDYCEEINIVRLGDLNVNSESDDADPKDFGIANVFNHKDYNVSSSYHDITILKLDKNITMSRYIRPACLPNEKDYKGSELSITGWGATKSAGTSASHLQKTLVEEFDQGMCFHLYSRNSKFSSGLSDNGQICAGSQNSNKDACTGDSGGPLQHKHPDYPCMYIISGVTSYGAACGINKVPGVYTRVFNYIEWIESVVWGN